MKNLKRNKGWRNYVQFLKWKNRLRKEAGRIYVKAIDKDTPEWEQMNINSRRSYYVYNVKTSELINDNAFSCYRTTSTPCSCSMCAYDKYDRKEKKKEDRRLINEWKNE